MPNEMSVPVAALAVPWSVGSWVLALSLLVLALAWFVVLPAVLETWAAVGTRGGEWGWGLSALAVTLAAGAVLVVGPVQIFRQVTDSGGIAVAAALGGLLAVGLAWVGRGRSDRWDRWFLWGPAVLLGLGVLAGAIGALGTRLTEGFGGANTGFLVLMVLVGAAFWVLESRARTPEEELERPTSPTAPAAAERPAPAGRARSRHSA